MASVVPSITDTLPIPDLMAEAARPQPDLAAAQGRRDAAIDCSMPSARTLSNEAANTHWPSAGPASLPLDVGGLADLGGLLSLFEMRD